MCTAVQPPLNCFSCHELSHTNFMNLFCGYHTVFQEVLVFGEMGSLTLLKRQSLTQ